MDQDNGNCREVGEHFKPACFRFRNGILPSFIREGLGMGKKIDKKEH